MCSQFCYMNLLQNGLQTHFKVSNYIDTSVNTVANAWCNYTAQRLCYLEWCRWDSQCKWTLIINNSSCGKVMFSQASVILSTRGGHAWQGACIARGYAWQGTFMVGGMHGFVGVHGRGHAWLNAFLFLLKVRRLQFLRFHLVALLST